MAKASKPFAEAESDLAQRKIAEIDADYKDMFARIMNVKDVVPELARRDDRQDLSLGAGASGAPDPATPQTASSADRGPRPSPREPAPRRRKPLRQQRRRARA